MQGFSFILLKVKSTPTSPDTPVTNFLAERYARCNQSEPESRKDF